MQHISRMKTVVLDQLWPFESCFLKLFKTIKIARFERLLCCSILSQHKSFSFWIWNIKTILALILQKTLDAAFWDNLVDPSIIWDFLARNNSSWNNQVILQKEAHLLKSSTQAILYKNDLKFCWLSITLNYSHKGVPTSNPNFSES